MKTYIISHILDLSIVKLKILINYVSQIFVNRIEVDFYLLLIQAYNLFNFYDQILNRSQFYKENYSF